VKIDVAAAVAATSNHEAAVADFTDVSDVLAVEGNPERRLPERTVVSHGDTAILKFDAERAQHVAPYPKGSTWQAQPEQKNAGIMSRELEVQAGVQGDRCDGDAQRHRQEQRDDCGDGSLPFAPDCLWRNFVDSQHGRTGSPSNPEGKGRRPDFQITLVAEIAWGFDHGQAAGLFANILSSCADPSALTK
jgi:hypothetical protein